MRAIETRSQNGAGLDFVAESSAPDDVLRIWKDITEAFPRIILDPQAGAVLVGNGTVAPAAAATTGGLLIANDLSDLHDVPTALVNLGLSTAKHLTGTATWDPASLLTQTSDSKAVTVTGAALGDTVAVGFTTAVPAGLLLVGAVTATNTVTVTLYNSTVGTVDLASGTVRADVWHL